MTAPEVSMARFRCSACNWVYDEEVEGKPFADLPDDWTCPQCGAPKSAFVPEARQGEDMSIETTVADTGSSRSSTNSVSGASTASPATPTCP
jgi:rubredoxin